MRSVYLYHPAPPTHTHTTNPENGCADCRDLYERTAAVIYRHQACYRSDVHRPHHWGALPPTPKVHPETLYCPGRVA